MLGDPVNFVDPTGENPWLAILWALTLGWGVTDIYDGKDPTQSRPMQRPQHEQKEKQTKNDPRKKKKKFPKKGKWCP